MFNFEFDEKKSYIISQDTTLKFINSNKHKNILYHNKIVNQPAYENSLTRYIIEKKINKGGSSIVYQGIDSITNEKIIIKELQSANINKLNREINILDICRTIPNTIKLIDFYKKDDMYYIIFPYIECPQSRTQFYNFNNNEIKIFMKTILTTIKNIHNNGIIHRDIKPSNILINSPKNIFIIDFGVSDFYLPFRKFSNKIGTKNFRSPEQIVGVKGFDYKIDIWAIGIIFAEIIFHKFPFIKPEDDDKVIQHIAKLSGKSEFIKFLKKYNIELEKYSFIDDIDNESIIYDLCKKCQRSILNNPDTTDLLFKLINIDPNKRISAEKALEHDFFNN